MDDEFNKICSDLQSIVSDDHRRSAGVPRFPVSNFNNNLDIPIQPPHSTKTAIRPKAKPPAPPAAFVKIHAVPPEVAEAENRLARLIAKKEGRKSINSLFRAFSIQKLPIQ